MIIYSLFILTSCSFFNQEETVVENNSVYQKNSIDTINVESVQNIENPKFVYHWNTNFKAENSITNRIVIPEGYNRIKLDDLSFGMWLRYIPLKEGRSTVYLYNGEQKWNQKVHEAVIDMDVGTRDLQQCADAVIRLRAEYLYTMKKIDKIHFNYTSGVEVSFNKWSKGFRASPVKGGQLRWSSCGSCNSSYNSFKKYLINIFNYAGTLSLSKELKSKEIEHIKSGDVFIKGGSPGHAVMVMDVAENKNGEKIFLLAQSYMPAQEMHILKNNNDDSMSPWYKASEIEDAIYTPEWTFNRNSLKEW